jgi:type VII secretion-associated protein (TIGR03931 family)
MAGRPDPGADGPGDGTGRRGRRFGRTRRSTIAWLVAAVVLALAAGGAALTLAQRDGAAGSLADYHFRFSVPEGWHRTGGDQRLRQVDLGPAEPAAGRPDPSQIVVRELELAYDGGADRERAVAELGADYERRRAQGDPLSGFDPAATFAGRAVVHYVEAAAAVAATDWYVVFEGRYQISVGCRHDDAGLRRVLAACEQVVDTLTGNRG